MIGEGNDTGTNTKNHTWVDLAVCPSVCLLTEDRPYTLVGIFFFRKRISSLKLLGNFQVFRCHGNHDRFFFFSINIFHDTRLHKTIPTEVTFPALFRIEVRWQLLVLFQLADVLLIEHQRAAVLAIGVIVDDVQWPANTASVGEDLKLPLTDIPNQTNLVRDHVTSTKGRHGVDEVSRVTMNTNPDTVDEDLGGIWRHLRLELLQDFHVTLNHEIDDGLARCTNGNIAHERQVLDQTTSLTFWCFCRAYQTPMGVVKLPRFGDLSVTTNRGIRPTKMRQC